MYTVPSIRSKASIAWTGGSYSCGGTRSCTDNTQNVTTLPSDIIYVCFLKFSSVQYVYRASPNCGCFDTRVPFSHTID